MRGKRNGSVCQTLNLSDQMSKRPHAPVIVIRKTDAATQQAAEELSIVS